MRIAVVAVAMAVVLAGCGGSGESGGADPLPAPSPSASDAPSEEATASARPDDVKSDEGAMAFSKFVVNQIVEVSAGQNVDDLLGLSRGATCQGCINLAKDLKEAGSVRQEFDAVPEVSEVRVTDKQGDTYLVEQSVVLAPGRKVDTATGKVTETFDKTPLTFTISMTWSEGQWVLVNYSAKDPT